jgi:hypothetical protein
MLIHEAAVVDFMTVLAIRAAQVTRGCLFVDTLIWFMQHTENNFLFFPVWFEERASQIMK